MEYSENFQRYYFKYMGITPQDLAGRKNIFSSSQRERPLNNWYFQHLIVTNVNNINVFSIVPGMYKDFKGYITPFKDMDISEMTGVLRVFFDGKFEDYSIRKMYRMTLDSAPKDLMVDNIAVKLTKEILINNLQSISINHDEINEIWCRKKNEVNQGRQYVILDKSKIVSYCKVSNIDYNGGNLTVYTQEKYRNRGYGKSVSIEAIKWCDDNGIIPIYWVDEKNATSVALAKSLGFKIMSEEIVVGTKSQQ